jgi:hypothetical protein
LDIWDSDGCAGSAQQGMARLRPLTLFESPLSAELSEVQPSDRRERWTNPRQGEAEVLDVIILFFNKFGAVFQGSGGSQGRGKERELHT